MVHRVVDSQPGQLLAKQIEQQMSSHVIGPWLDLGFFNWYSTSKVLNSYGDLKGLKIRNNGGAPLQNVPLGLSQGTAVSAALAAAG
jgi:C4-dicarboxylate-binding protein DctP